MKKSYAPPDEKTAGPLVMHFDCGCDIVVIVGSCVIDDICKIPAKISGRLYIIAATYRQ